jgi:hypothetical protein
VAEAGRLGIRAVACDVQYGRDIRELKRSCEYQYRSDDRGFTPKCPGI